MEIGKPENHLALPHAHTMRAVQERVSTTTMVWFAEAPLGAVPDFSNFITKHIGCVLLVKLTFQSSTFAHTFTSL